MEPQMLSSGLSTCTTAYSHKAWNFVTLLLSLGRPACPAELAAKCSLFNSSPEFVEFLCSIPNSPLYLTRNGFVTLSMVALVAFGEFIANSMPRIEMVFSGVRELIGGRCVRTYFRKRKRLSNDALPLVKKRLNFPDDVDNQGGRISCSSYRVESSLLGEHDNKSAQMQWFMNALPFCSSDTPFSWGKCSDVVALTLFTANCNIRLSESQLQLLQEKVVETKQDTSPVAQGHKHISKLGSQCSYIYDDELCRENSVMPSKLFLEPAISSQAKNLMVLEQPSLDVPDMIGNCEKRKKKLEDQTVLDCCSPRENIDFKCSSGACYDQRIMSLETRGTLVCNEPKMSQGMGLLLSSLCQQSSPKISAVSPVKLENVHGDASTLRSEVPLKGLQHLGTDGLRKVKQKGNQNSISRKHKSKQTGPDKVPVQQKGEKTRGASSKDNLEARALPTFESYVVEEEEGSGGYGTVYRARRKSDGITFAIKYPHPNAHKHHVNNEQKMLERFGGKNFVIKYEGSFKSGKFDCFVLEYVEHVRPEVLKREIELVSLRWYAYCMFRALASLHKQGVAHRDVKPGNFLFSCKTCKGYLIDFNLAKDLHQKPGNTGKSKSNAATGFQPIPGPQLKAGSPSKTRKIPSSKFSDALIGGSVRGSKPTLECRMLKRKADGKVKAQNELGRRNSLTSQGADGSGLTSAKDATSGRTPAERLKEPLPCQGRRELINLAHEAMQSMDHESASAPALKRKRVAAPPGIVNSKRVYFTPMPLHSSGVAIAGSGLLKKRGEEKPQKEGPCVGTKGFRAPEVLLRSGHQGPKVDLWSAGVTLLYLITGKMPFAGEPEQNMREIVKIRGSEDLWEVAKLHNRESSFPADLFDARFLPSMKLQEWCKVNAKRPKFIEDIPASLYDLVDRCLTVNPRLRISAEDALRHEFFAPCHEAFQRLRSRKQDSSLDSKASYTDERKPIECSQ